MATLSARQIAQQVQTQIEAAEKTNRPVAFVRDADGVERRLTKKAALDALADWKNLLATKPDGTDRPLGPVSVMQLHVIDELIGEVGAESQQTNKLVDLDRELVTRTQAIGKAITDKKYKAAEMKAFAERSAILQKEFGLLD